MPENGDFPENRPSALLSISEIGGRPKPAQAPSNSTGIEPGKPGCGAMLTALERREAMAALLVATVADNDQALVAGLTRLCGSAPREKKRNWTDRDYGFMTEMIGYEMPPMLADTKRQAERLVSCALLTMDQQAIEEQIAATMIVTKSRSMSDGDRRLYMRVVAESLRPFPADVIQDAFRRIREQETWSPTLSEIRDRCHWLSRRRKFLAEALGMRPGFTE